MVRKKKALLFIEAKRLPVRTKNLTMKRKGFTTKGFGPQRASTDQRG
jgi:hypothetical protein